MSCRGTGEEAGWTGGLMGNSKSERKQISQF